MQVLPASYFDCQLLHIFFQKSPMNCRRNPLELNEKSKGPSMWEVERRWVGGRWPRAGSSSSKLLQWSSASLRNTSVPCLSSQRYLTKYSQKYCQQCWLPVKPFDYWGKIFDRILSNKFKYCLTISDQCSMSTSAKSAVWEYLYLTKYCGTKIKKIVLWINSQSLENTQVWYIWQKYTLGKYTLAKDIFRKYTLSNLSWNCP